MSVEFLTAYLTVSSFTPSEAREKLEVLRRYLLPLEKEISDETFRELFASVFLVPEHRLSLIRNLAELHIHLYNLTLRRSKNEELIKDEETEYIFVKEYEELVKHFPYVNIDAFSEEVLTFFAMEGRDDIEGKIPDELKERIRKCSSPPVLIEGDKYTLIQCYSEEIYRERRRPAYILYRGKKEKVESLYPYIKLYFFLTRGSKV